MRALRARRVLLALVCVRQPAPLSRNARCGGACELRFQRASHCSSRAIVWLRLTADVVARAGYQRRWGVVVLDVRALWFNLGCVDKPRHR
jgi:hypothetical protein